MRAFFARYRKAFVAGFGLALMAVNVAAGDPFEAGKAYDLVVALLTGLGVWGVPNAPTQPTE